MIKNYLEFIEEIKGKYGDRVVFEYLDEELQIQSITYEQFYADVCRWVVFLQKKEICHKKIGIFSENSYLWMVAYYSIMISGNVAVLYPKDMQKDVMQELVVRTDTEYLFYSKEVSFESGMHKIEDAWKLDEVNKLAVYGQEVLRCETDLNNLSCILFTSGTTVAMKGVSLSLKNCLAGVNQQIGSSSLNKFGKIMMTLPFSHVNSVASASILALGMTICILDNPKYFVRNMVAMNPDSLSVVPSFLDTICKRLQKKKDKTEILGTRLSHISCSGAILSKEMVEFFLQKGIIVSNSYGLTESAGIGIIMVYKAGVKCDKDLLGKSAEGIELETVDGEIVMRGDGIMMGYYKDEEATKEVLRNGWLYTGDLGYRDEDGYWHITGRKKNLIILSNGENVNPEELEEYMRHLPGISECMAYGKNDRICLSVVPNDDTQEQRTSIHKSVEEVNNSLPLYKRITKIEFVKELPKTSTGKLKRYTGS